ncbi:MAG: cell wall hydrolase [Oscillospiraceae bacterium]
MKFLKNRNTLKSLLILPMLCLVIGILATSGKAQGAWTDRQTKAHEIAVLARSMGMPETDAIIVRAQEIWHEDYLIHINDPPIEALPLTYTDSDAQMLAKTLYHECRGIVSDTEKACIAWTILNRVDAGYADTISGVVTAAAQFAYSPNAPTWDNLLKLSYDVLNRWDREKKGETEVGRVLPKDYLWYGGDGAHNYFRNSYKGGTRWDYSLPSPYES